MTVFEHFQQKYFEEIRGRNSNCVFFLLSFRVRKYSGKYIHYFFIKPVSKGYRFHWEGIFGKEE